MVLMPCRACPALRLPLDFYWRKEGTLSAGHKCCDCIKKRQRSRYASGTTTCESGREGYLRRRRNRTLTVRYGITLAERDALIAAQNGRCAICEEPSARLVTDHDHVTKIVRAMLCNRCNVAVGVLENPRRSMWENYLEVRRHMAETEVKPESEAAQPEPQPEPEDELPRAFKTDLARLRPVQTPLTQPARFAFDNEQLALMKRTVARGADDNAFLLFLELVGRYKLDPFAKQVYLAKMPGKDGEPPIWTTIVARDGLLAIANRYDDFEGMEGDVIYGTDLISRTKDGFEHTYEAIQAKDRLKGDIVGAWCRVSRRGRKPTFFLAKFASYKTNNKTWTKYPDAMILKVAESMALRKAFSITGLVPEDEVGAYYDDRFGGVVDQNGGAVEQDPDWGPDEDLARRLQAAFGEANRIRPGSFLPQKIRLTLAGADQAKRTAVLQQVEDFVAQNGGSIPIEGEAEEADAEPVDAEPVEEEAGAA